MTTTETMTALEQRLIDSCKQMRVLIPDAIICSVVAGAFQMRSEHSPELYYAASMTRNEPDGAGLKDHKADGDSPEAAVVEMNKRLEDEAGRKYDEKLKAVREDARKLGYELKLI